VVHGDFGIDKVLPNAFSDRRVLDMMKKLSFEVDDALEACFPSRRICRAEIETANGSIFLSPNCEPRGEACENITNEWLTDKFRRMTAPLLNASEQEKIVCVILGDENERVRHLVDLTNGCLNH
jgi:2-methylcitrate dehydratase PrpD